MQDQRFISRVCVDIALLWPLTILAGAAFWISLVPLPPNDFWWHLKVGEVIYRTGVIPRSNIFAWTLPTDSPFVYGAWLGEFLLYLLHRWGGLSLVIVSRTWLGLTSFALMGYEAWRRSGSWRLATPALALAFLMSLNNLIIRTQIWSWLPFVIYLMLLSRYVDRQLKVGWLLVCPLLMVFWVNAHGAFLLGIVLFGIFLVGEVLDKLVRQEDALTWRAIGAMAGIAVLVVAATFINPYFSGIVDYVADLMTDVPSQSLIEEWQSPTPEGVANVTFYLSILLLLGVLAYSHYRPRPTDALLSVSFLWLAWSGQRYVIWYGFVFAPIFSQALAGLPIRLRFGSPQRSLLNSVLAILLFAPAFLVQPWWVERMPLPDTYWELVWRSRDEGPLIEVGTPLDAVAYLEAYPGGQLFNEMGYGSYLIWALPEQEVFIDPRVELYDYDQWIDYVKISRGVRYNELLSEYGADRILLNLALQPDLSFALATDPLWEKEYEDTYSQIWRHTGRR